MNFFYSSSKPWLVSNKLFEVLKEGQEIIYDNSNKYDFFKLIDADNVELIEFVFKNFKKVSDNKYSIKGKGSNFDDKVDVETIKYFLQNALSQHRSYIPLKTMQYLMDKYHLQFGDYAKFNLFFETALQKLTKSKLTNVSKEKTNDRYNTIAFLLKNTLPVTINKYMLIQLLTKKYNENKISEKDLNTLKTMIVSNTPFPDFQQQRNIISLTPFGEKVKEKFVHPAGKYFINPSTGEPVNMLRIIHAYAQLCDGKGGFIGIPPENMTEQTKKTGLIILSNEYLGLSITEEDDTNKICSILEQKILDLYSALYV